MRARVVTATIVTVALALAACSTTTTRSTTPDNGVEVSRRDSPPPDPRKRATIRLQLAVGYYQDGKFAIALDELKQAIAIDPGFADAYMMVAMVYTEIAETALAEQNFARALQLEPNNADVNNNYGWYLCQHGREKDSLAYFANAFKDPLYAQRGKPLQNAGVCANKIGNPVLAEQYFQRSFEIDPGGSVAAYNLAQIYYQREDFTRAKFYVGQVNRGPGSTPASLWLAIRIERRLGNRNDEIALENQLTRQFADSREAQMQRRGNYSD